MTVVTGSITDQLHTLLVRAGDWVPTDELLRRCRKYRIVTRSSAREALLRLVRFGLADKQLGRDPLRNKPLMYWRAVEKKMEFAEAQKLIEAGTLFGDVADKVTPEQLEDLKRWYCEHRSLPNLAARDKAKNPAKVHQARAQGFTGDACGGCGSFMMTRNGSCLSCQQCGQTSGCS